MAIRFLCAPDSFKESLSASQAAAAMARGIARALPEAEINCCPIADGGEGTVEALTTATGGRLMQSTVQGPFGEPVAATWGLLGDGRTAVIEMAAASGLALVPPEKRNPLLTHTFGTGQLIAAALAHGAAAIILGIGGSATTDGGCAMAQALGVRLLNETGDEIVEPVCGGLLGRVAKVDTCGLNPRLSRVQITVACDVTNPLTGPEGAAAIYGPQKGATSEQVQRLDEGLAHLAGRWRADLGRDVADMPGGGAAGGLGAGLVAFLGAELRPGVDLVLDAVGFDDRVRRADWCLTGEGRLDGQSIRGKACIGVARAASRHGVPTWALVGSTGPSVEETLDAGLAGYRLIGEGLDPAESVRRAEQLLERAAAMLAVDLARR